MTLPLVSTYLLRLGFAPCYSLDLSVFHKLSMFLHGAEALYTLFPLPSSIFLYIKALLHPSRSRWDVACPNPPRKVMHDLLWASTTLHSYNFSNYVVRNLCLHPFSSGLLSFLKTWTMPCWLHHTHHLSACLEHGECSWMPSEHGRGCMNK